MKNNNIKKIELKQIISGLIAVPILMYAFMCGMIYFVTKSIEQTKLAFYFVTVLVILYLLIYIFLILSKKERLSEKIEISEFNTDKEIDVSTIKKFYIIKTISRTAGTIYDNYLVVDNKDNLIYTVQKYKAKYFVMNPKGDYIGEIKQHISLLTPKYTVKLNSGTKFSVRTLITSYYDYEIDGLPYISASDTVYKNGIYDEEGKEIAVLNAGIISEDKKSKENEWVKLGNSTVTISKDAKSSEELVFLMLTINISKTRSPNT